MPRRGTASSTPRRQRTQAPGPPRLSAWLAHHRESAGTTLRQLLVQPVAALPGVEELHIGHAIVSRAVLVGMREAVSQMKRLLREASAAGG